MATSIIKKPVSNITWQLIPASSTQSITVDQVCFVFINESDVDCGIIQCSNTVVKTISSIGTMNAEVTKPSRNVLQIKNNRTWNINIWILGVNAR